ncbi:type IX secretion system plug protein [Reichenbachiella versicolor]|uniref:type IX secretion system plug protein n=1 Tax=Reichenbachiella versicolor TaxID=1821036 RepID=UPI000D6E354E|nr:type IX secretion system plug protein domain-containing protein [Reichenbachiella versicolor]
MNNLSIYVVFAFLLSLVFSNLQAQRSEEKVFDNENFNRKVGTVQLMPMSAQGGAPFQPAIIPLSGGQLILRFDLLEEEYSTLSARLIHCDAGWTKSALNDIDYLRQYNAFDILDFDYSMNSQKMYVHYWFRIPRVLKSGNYIVQVFQDNDKRKVLFQRRFVVYENVVGIQPTVRVSTSAKFRRTHHQIDFSVFYKGVGKVASPMTEFKAVVRQNNRWDNALSSLKPSNMNVAQNRIDYKHFDGSNNILAGNEFRFFDLRTFSVRGLYVQSINRRMNPVHAQITPGEARGRFYSLTPDQNGYFIISTREAGARSLEADYLNVTFRLKSEPILDPVYITGAFNDWKQDENSMMMYDPQSKSYFRTILLKQGQYDYQYVVGGDKPLQFEGTFLETRNDYDILIYHRSFTDLADRVVGYATFKSEL